MSSPRWTDEKSMVVVSQRRPEIEPMPKHAQLKMYIIILQEYALEYKWWESGVKYLDEYGDLYYVR